MKIQETLAAHLHEVRQWKESRINPGEQVLTRRDGRVYACPNCTRRVTLKHGDSKTCECSMEMTLYGNGLVCTIEESMLIPKVKPTPPKPKTLLQSLFGRIKLRG